MALVTLAAVTLKTPDLARTLVRDLSISFGTERTGLVGRNGVGKSHLLSVIAGRAEPAVGHIVRSGRVGLLQQHFDDLSIPITQALGMHDAVAATAKIIAGQGSDADLAAADWMLEPRIEATMGRVGLGGINTSIALSRLSGGQRMRVSIARVFLENADLLLLDEPTNNLDSAGRKMITDLVANWRGGVIVAGHDRTLLETMDRILELSQTGARIYSGGWSAYHAQRQSEIEAAQAELDRATRALKTTEIQIQRQHERKARRDKMGRAKRAQDNEPRVALDSQQGRAEKSLGRDKQLGDHLLEGAVAAREAAADEVDVIVPTQFDLPTVHVPHSRVLLQMKAVEYRIDDGRTLGPWDLEIVGPQRVRVIGPNGAGKTTLMKLASGLIDPSKGEVERLAPMAYLGQDLSMPAPDGRLIDNIRLAQPDITEHDARATLARFGFRNVTADRDVMGLSGGERLRLSLCMAFSGAVPPECLLLDEPTNHLDIDAIALFEATLENFEGAILFVTHDDAFAKALKALRLFEVR